MNLQPFTANALPAIGTLQRALNAAAFSASDTVNRSPLQGCDLSHCCIHVTGALRQIQTSELVNERLLMGRKG